METKKLKEILELSKNEKIELFNILYENIEEEYCTDISTEQINTIKKRFERIDKGETEIKDWDDVKKKYNKFV